MIAVRTEPDLVSVEYIVSNDKKQTAIRRIQKLEALAASETKNGNDTAAESAARIAQRMMVDYALSRADIAVEDDEPLIKKASSTGRALMWLRTLYSSVAIANNCILSYVPGSNTVHFYGTESDIEVAEYLAVYLAREVQAAADAHIKEARAEHGCVPTGERSGFCGSCVASLSRRLTAMRREAAKAAKAAHGDAAVGTALVRLDQSLQRANDFAQTFGLGTGRSASYNHNPAGAQAGKRININKGVSGSSSRRTALTA
jgi:hypothetical protein